MSNPQQPGGRLVARPRPSRVRGLWTVPLAVVAGLVLVAAVGAVQPADDAPARTAAQQTPSQEPPEQPAPQVAPAPADSRPSAAPRPVPAAAVLLEDAGDGDGDSWHDTAGREYRLGLVNTPERNECFGSEATAERKALTAAGFSARSYTQDTYGRAVSVVQTAAGLNLNVHLARRGFADDRYLDRFRHEDPRLAEQLDAAFAAAKAEGAGLWSACRSDDAVRPIVAAPAPAKQPAPAAPAPAGGCHPDYATCIPVQGDGSGRGQANDLDCGDISGSVRLRAVGTDPYRLDGDGDGVGCD